jgi:hypothetical protein
VCTHWGGGKQPEASGLGRRHTAKGPGAGSQGRCPSKPGTGFPSFPALPLGVFLLRLPPDLARCLSREPVFYLDGLQLGPSTEAPNGLQPSPASPWGRWGPRKAAGKGALIRDCTLPDIASGNKTPLSCRWGQEHRGDQASAVASSPIPSLSQAEGEVAQKEGLRASASGRGGQCSIKV